MVHTMCVDPLNDLNCFPSYFRSHAIRLRLNVKYSIITVLYDDMLGYQRKSGVTL